MMTKEQHTRLKKSFRKTGTPISEMYAKPHQTNTPAIVMIDPLQKPFYVLQSNIDRNVKAIKEKLEAK